MINNSTEREILESLADPESRRVTAEDLIELTVNPPTVQQNYPDAKKHQIISFIKSGIRILGYCFIPFNLVVSAILLILSEIVGIIEELV